MLRMRASGYNYTLASSHPRKLHGALLTGALKLLGPVPLCIRALAGALRRQLSCLPLQRTTPRAHSRLVARCGPWWWSRRIADT